jgi:hypothetical protein
MTDSRRRFLHGMQWSCGDLNVHLKGPTGYEVMSRRATMRGLDDAGRYMANMLNKEKRKATRFAMEQQHLQMGPRGRLAIEQGPRGQREVQMLEDAAEDNMPGQLQRLDLDEYIHYE